MARNLQPGELSALALIAGGFLLVGMTLAGYLVGYAFDRTLHSAPVGAVVGLMLGMIAGVWDLYRMAMRIMRQQPAPPPTNAGEEEGEQAAGDDADDRGAC